MENSHELLITIILTLSAGVSIIILSNYLRIPAIVPLLICGVFLGRFGLNIVKPELLGNGLKIIISLSVALILFDGGLNLNINGFKRAPKVIQRLLTIGVLITWIVTTTIIHLIFKYDLSFSLLCSSLIIVTGPTVITPILQRVKLSEKIHQILHWEAVLIDPIGVFIAVLCFEWYIIKDSLSFHILYFSLRLIIGLALGIFGGLSISWIIKRSIVPTERINIFVFSVALFLFGLSDYILPESGILTVVVAGITLGWKNPEGLKKIKEFKSELTDIAIGILFILLAANLNMKIFIHVEWKIIVLIILVIFFIRPLVIFTSSIKTRLTFREKLFLSWIAPRGIVAASMASLFAIQMKSGTSTGSMMLEKAEFIELFTFSIIIVTVILQGISAGPVSSLLKLKGKKDKGWLIVGAHYFSRQIAEFITENTQQRCYLIDTNADAVIEARDEGYFAFQGDALNPDKIPSDIISSVENLIALTDNRELNEMICKEWIKHIKRNRLFFWSTIDSEIEKINGVKIWNEMVSPSEISYQLRNYNNELLNISLKEFKEKHIIGFPLMAAFSEQIIFTIPEDLNIPDAKLLVFTIV